jgi:flagellar biosynthesis protein FliP
LAKESEPAKPEDISLRVLAPGFMISELKRAFEIDFLLFLPFLMLPLVVVSLPFKPIFFVLVAGSLIHSYGT